MREHFLLDPDIVFLNHGSFGACPRAVFDRYQDWQRELERNPVEFLSRRSGALLAQARRVLADHLGAQADDLAFVANATTGVNIVARSLVLQPGDEVLAATDQEYGACDAIWRQACTAQRAHYRHVPLPLPFDSGAWVDRVMAATSQRTRLIFSSHVTSTTALILPVAALCAAARRRDIATLIDGAHAPGQLPLALSAIGADYYTGNAHKWLCAPKGAAFLHARRELHDGLQAPLVSWGRVADEHDAATAAATAQGQPALPARGFDAYTGSTPLQRRLQWQGTRDIAAYLSVPAAIDFQQRHGWPQWQARCHALACATRERVTRRNGLAAIATDQDHAQMVPIPVRCTDADALRRQLFDQHRIEVPVTEHRGQAFVRLSVQAYNSQADLDALVAALDGLGV